MRLKPLTQPVTTRGPVVRLRDVPVGTLVTLVNEVGEPEAGTPYIVCETHTALIVLNITEALDTLAAGVRGTGDRASRLAFYCPKDHCVYRPDPDAFVVVESD